MYCSLTHTITAATIAETLVSRRAPKIMFRVKKDGVDMRYMFEFGTDLSRDQCKDLVNRIFNEFRDRTIPLQVKQKLHILASDPHLKKMHRELVDGGVLSEKEFWESRKQLLVNEAARVDYQVRMFSFRRFFHLLHVEMWCTLH